MTWSDAHITHWHPLKIRKRRNCSISAKLTWPSAATGVFLWCHRCLTCRRCTWNCCLLRLSWCCCPRCCWDFLLTLVPSPSCRNAISKTHMTYEWASFISQSSWYQKHFNKSQYTPITSNFVTCKSLQCSILKPCQNKELSVLWLLVLISRFHSVQ